jgi:hypothetical protein
MNINNVSGTFFHKLSQVFSTVCETVSHAVSSLYMRIHALITKKTPTSIFPHSFSFTLPKIEFPSHNDLARWKEITRPWVEKMEKERESQQLALAKLLASCKSPEKSFFLKVSKLPILPEIPQPPSTQATPDYRYHRQQLRQAYLDEISGFGPQTRCNYDELSREEKRELAQAVTTLREHNPKDRIVIC